MHTSARVEWGQKEYYFFRSLQAKFSLGVDWQMAKFWGSCLLWLMMLLLPFDILCLQGSLEHGSIVKSTTFLSPMFVLGPGLVENRFYDNIDFPRGHIGLKSFNGEVIDETGNPIPLHETYLHHWAVGRYFQCRGTEPSVDSDKEGLPPKDYIFAGNSGICQGNVLGQYFGLGSETRRTATYVPDPYGIEIGNPAEIPAGYEERWMLNVHAIDTRGVEDKLGCTECKCDLYNITVDEYGKNLTSEYNGGLRCCYDHTQCRVRQGFEGARRSLYLRYTVKWVDWEKSVVPVKIFILDVTDTGKRSNETSRLGPGNGCQVEYEVEACDGTDVAEGGCIDNKRTGLTMPTGGYVVYGVAHQHTGGIGSTLYGQDGRVICTSLPIYGQGVEAANEEGYIVGMTTCYPKPGSVKIMDGENLILESNYSSTRQHTGVMGLFYILVADQAPQHMPFFHILNHVHEKAKLPTYAWGIMALFGLAIVFAVGLRSWLKKGREDGYQPITA